MKRFTLYSLGLFLLFSAIMTYIVFSQRRNFPQQGRIVFEMGHRNYSVYTVKPNDSFGEQIRLVFNPQGSFDDRFVTGVDCSPDSRSLIFWYIFLYRYDIATFNLTRLVVGDGLSQQSVWSPDGTRIAYLDNRDNGPTRDIFAVDADGTNKTQLTDTPEQEIALAWSPDGQQIAFSYRQTVSSTLHGLGILNIDSGSISPLYDTPQRIGDVAWSPDGARIAFSMIDGAGGASSIYTIQPDGVNLMRLNGAGRHNITPRWSPDGSMISFSARESNGSFGLYVMNADGTAPYQVFLGLPGEDVFNRCWLS